MGPDIDNKQTNLIHSYPFRAEQKKFVKFRLLTAQFRLPMCTHPESTVRAILDNFRLWPRISAKRIKISATGNKLGSIAMLTYWSSGHVTLLRGEFQPPNFFPSLTYGAGRPHVGLCPLFLVYNKIPTICIFLLVQTYISLTVINVDNGSVVDRRLLNA